MKIQKRKFLSNLARIRIYQQSHPFFQRLVTPFRFLHALFLFFFMVIHTTDVSGNIILSFIKQTHQGLPRMDFLPFILSSLLTIISAFIILPLLFLSRNGQDLEHTDYDNRRSRLLLRCAAIFSSIFKYLGPLLLMAVISGIQINSFSDIYIYLIHFGAVISCQAIIIFCKEPTIYSYQLVVLSLSLAVLEPFQAYLLIAAVTLYCLKSKDNSLQDQTGYLSILILALILMAGEQTQDIIGGLHLTLILVLVVGIKLSYQPVFPLLSVEKESDFLLMIADKLDKDEDLSKQQIMQIAYVNEEFQSKCQSLSKEGFELSQKIQQKAPEHVDKSHVLRLLRLRLDIDAKISLNTHLLSIQRFECQLLDKRFSIATLYQIEKLSLEVQKSCIYEDIYRMQALIGKIEVKFVKIEDRINSSLIFKIQKQLQKFYICIGEGIEQLLALWKTIMIKEVREDVFENSITKMIRLETQSLKILQQLSNYKDMSFQKNLFNYWRKITNVNINNYFNGDTSKQNHKMMETTFMLISNGIIEDASHIIAKKITMNKEEQLIGLKISKVLYDFYNTFLERELNNIISISDVHKEIVIPFKILNHDKSFFPSSCNFKILPDFSQGVKYIINFIDRKEDVKKYALYCMENDTIEGFSQAFFEKYKIDESLLPEVISGQDVFNTAISAHITQEKLSVGMGIRCELKFNDLRKQAKGARACRNSIPLMVTIRDIYQSKQLNYVLLEMFTREETAILSAHDTIKQFVEGNEQETNSTYSTSFNQTLCKIRNPLESVIDDKLSRIKVTSRVSYFKIAVGLMLLALVLLFITLILVRMDTASTGDSLHNQLDIVDDTNYLIQKLYSLFYQYYQYYQMKSYPQQILSIQYYNTTAINKQYRTKSNANIVELLPHILQNRNPQYKSFHTLTYSNYSTNSNTDIINLVQFLQAAKTALATNDPTNLVTNYHLIYHFIDSFVPFKNDVLQEFRIRVKVWAIVLFICLILICLAIRGLHLRITLFKWNILQVYSEITQSHIRKYSRRLQDFINLLVRTKYYSQHNNSTGTSNKAKIKGLSSRDTFGEQVVRARLSTSKQVEVKGVKLKSTCSQLLNNNLVFLVPVVIAGFLWLYYQMVVSYDHQSDIVLDYFSSLQELTIVILRKATEFFQASMEADMPSASQSHIPQSDIFVIPTKLHQQLPSIFQDYKKVENQMLNYNLCEYSYLNTGSLYKGIDCSNILDGMMNRGFTETYVFLLQTIKALRGAPLSTLGAQNRPSAHYPFFMEVCYARRTINNMIAVVQKKFASAVDGFLSSKQTSLQSAGIAGFFLLPLAAGLFWVFARRLRSDCEKAIKCFRILPRSFLMKIGVSKKLYNLGALQQIQLIAA